MKKRVFISFIILLLVVLIFSIIYLIYIEKRDSKVSLEKEYVCVEYGNTYNPNIDELIDFTKYSFINKDNIRVENNIQNENEKDYPAVGKYEINVYYKNKCLKQNIEVIDTIKPELSIKESIEIPFNTDLNSYNFKESVNITDLSQVKDCYFDFSNVNSNASGEYIAKVSVEDIYSNKSEKEFKIIVQENEKSIDNLGNLQNYSVTKDNKENTKVTTNVEKSISKSNKTSTSTSITNQGTKQAEEKKETAKQPTKQTEITRCTTNNNHSMDVGNSNMWFNSRNEAIAYYNSLITDLGSKLESGNMLRDEYNQKCPYRL